jgi:hypothetical protein
MQTPGAAVCTRILKSFLFINLHKKMERHGDVPPLVPLGW